MGKRIWIIGTLIIVALLAIFFSREKEFTSTQWLMNTRCEIKVISRVPPRNAINRAFSVMEQIDSIASWSGSGDIARINKGEPVKLSDKVLHIIKQGMKVGDLTHGAFDITIRSLMELWDNFESQCIPEKEEIEKILPLINYKEIMLTDSKIEFGKPKMKLDLSGIAKGYAVDLAVKELKRAGIKAGLVNAGGDIKVFGDRLWKIGIKDPRGTGIVKVLELKNKAVATSGDYEKYFMLDGVRYHHILNPRTGLPARECVSVTIISEDAVFADALSTGIFVFGPEKGIALLDSLRISGLIITSDSEFFESKVISLPIK